MPRYLVVLCLLFVPTFVSAQTTATISGTVQDSDGGVMPGVTVTATNAATSLVRTTVSNVEGRYVLAGLPPGEYELRAEIAGFTPQVRRGLPLTVAETVVANLTLQIGALEIRDEVIGVRPLVNTSSSELSYLVGTETIENLPLNGRNYTDLALLQPGVLAYPHRDGGSVVAHGLGISVNGQDPEPTCTCSTARCRTTSPTGRPEAPPEHRSAWRASANSASKPTPTARSSDESPAGRSTC